MKTFRFEEELLKEGYQFFANNQGNGAYVLLKNGDIEDDYVANFEAINDYFNIKESVTNDKYLLVFYDKFSKFYKVMIVNKKYILKYPLLTKLFCKNKVAAVEVQGILSILNTKLRQNNWPVSEILRTDIDNIPTLTRKYEEKVRFF